MESSRTRDWTHVPCISRCILNWWAIREILYCVYNNFEDIEGVLGFPCGSAGKEFPFNMGDLGSIPGLGRSLGEEKGYPLQYSGLEDSIDYTPWGRQESDTTEWLHFHFSLSCIGEVNGSPLQYSCLENARDGSLVGCRLWGHTELDTTDVT